MRTPFVVVVNITFSRSTIGTTYLTKQYIQNSINFKGFKKLILFHIDNLRKEKGGTGKCHPNNTQEKMFTSFSYESFFSFSIDQKQIILLQLLA